MYLAGQRVAGRGYNHYLGTVPLPLPLNEGDLIRLVKRLRTGDTSVINMIVGSHIRLATQIVGRYHATVSHVSVNDMVGVALLALTQGTRRAMHKLVNNTITPYLVTAIHSALAKFIAEDFVVRIPQQTQSDYGYALPQQHTELLKDAYGNADTVISIVCLDELLDLSCTSSIDREIIKQRRRGRTDAEIASIVGLCRATVRNLRMAIYERFCRLEQESEHGREEEPCTMVQGL